MRPFLVPTAGRRRDTQPFHGLQGKPKRYSVRVNGPWCITFEWQGENAVKVDLENYH